MISKETEVEQTGDHRLQFDSGALVSHYHYFNSFSTARTLLYVIDFQVIINVITFFPGCLPKAPA